MRNFWGIFIGSFLGSRYAGLPGVVIGSVIGFFVERKIRLYFRTAGSQGERRSSPDDFDGVSRAYEILGVSSSASNEELRDAYRRKAKKYHPDLLRAKGAGEKEMRRANNRMAQLNEAWAKIKNARHLT